MANLESVEVKMSVVVVGVFAPAIHHPAWYRLAGILDAEGETQALKHPVVCTQVQSRFRTSKWQMDCLPQKWQVQTLGKGDLQDILKVAVRMSTKLPETPVEAYGMNRHVHLKTGLENVGCHIGRLLQEARFGFPPVGEGAGMVKLTDYTPERLYNMIVEASSKGPEYVYVTHNTHCPITETSMQYFDLGKMLSKTSETSHKHFESLMSSVLKAMNGDGE